MVLSYMQANYNIIKMKNMRNFKQLSAALILSILALSVNAQWEVVLPDTNVTEVFVSDTNIFIGTDAGNIYLSQDEGQTWTDLTYNLPDNYIGNIGICDSNKLVCTCGNRVYTSSTWTGWDNVCPLTSSVNSMVIDGPNIFVGAGSSEGIHASFDNGNNWSDISSNLTDKYITSVSVYMDTLLVSTYMGGIFLSTDTGGSWNAYNQGMSETAFSLTKNTTFFAGGSFYIHKLENGSWTQVFTTSQQILDFANKQSFIAAVGLDLFISADSGSNWLKIAPTYTTFGLRKVDFYDDYLLVGNFDGLYKFNLNYLSINETGEKKQEFYIYPNPVQSDFIDMYLVSDSNEDIHIAVLDVNGRTVLENTCEAQKQKYPIRVNNIDNGIYTVNVWQGQTYMSEKIVIMK